MGDSDNAIPEHAIRQPVGAIALYGTQLQAGRKGQRRSVPVGVSIGRELLVRMSRQGMEPLVPSVTLGAGDTTIFQSLQGPVEDIMLWVNNRTAAQLALTLNHRVNGATTANGNQLITTFPIGPLRQLVLPGAGIPGFAMGPGDILSGLGNGLIVFAYGRRILS